MTLDSKMAKHFKIMFILNMLLIQTLLEKGKGKILNTICCSNSSKLLTTPFNLCITDSVTNNFLKWQEPCPKVFLGLGKPGKKFGHKRNVEIHDVHLFQCPKIKKFQKFFFFKVNVTYPIFWFVFLFFCCFFSHTYFI